MILSKIMKRAYYQNSILNFLRDTPESILGELARHHHFELDLAQKNAWLQQIANLKEQLVDFQFGEIFFEFSIPRMGKRADVVLYLMDIVFVLEYKVGAKTYDLVKDDGFEYRDKIYGSLSEVAYAITGTRWNGWVFFNLKKRGGAK